MGCSPTVSSVYGILQARILEWIAMTSSRRSSWLRDQTCISCVSCIGRRVLYHQCHLGNLWEQKLSNLWLHGNLLRNSRADTHGHFLFLLSSPTVEELREELNIFLPPEEPFLPGLFQGQPRFRIQCSFYNPLSAQQKGAWPSGEGRGLTSQGGPIWRIGKRGKPAQGDCSSQPRSLIQILPVMELWFPSPPARLRRLPL